MPPTVHGGDHAGRSGTQVPSIANLYLAGHLIGEGFLADASFSSMPRRASAAEGNVARSSEKMLTEESIHSVCE